MARQRTHAPKPSPSDPPSAAGVRLMQQPRLGLRVWFGSSHGMNMAHVHRDIEFNYVLQGQMNYLIGGRLVVVPPGRLTVIWGAMPHQNLQTALVDTTSNHMAWATFPLDGTLLNNLPATFVQQFLSQGIIVAPDTRPGDLELFTQWQRDLQAADRARHALVQQEMELRLHRLALDVTRKKSPARRKPSKQPWPQQDDTPDAAVVSTPHLEPVQAMAAYIASHFAQPISTADVVAQVPLHPNYAMTLFARHTHTTISQYLTRQRIAHAQRLLATTSQSILEVGFACGFGSTSRFHEAFKQLTGVSPRAHRRQMTWQAPA